ncbi:MAG: sugar ABC transporter ATP-binding protein [Clostridiaceae bacterium]|nr:sugar ABC transporter ATP-binding protein [Clostridiaceae bacterium]
MRHELLRLEDICLNRQELPVLDHLHLNLFQDEILCVAGLYGSGRRTLAQVLSGELAADSGRIFLSEKRMCASPHKRRFPGVFHVTERLSLLPQLSVAENLNIPYTHRRWVRWKQIYAEAAQVLQDFSLPFGPSALPSSLSFAEQLKLELLRAYTSRASVVAIDPLWGQLSQDELAQIQLFLKQLQSRHLSFLLFTNPELIPAISDRVVLLRHGQAIRTLTPNEAASAPIADWLRDAPLPGPPLPLPAAGRCILDAHLPHFPLRLHAGEIAGIWYGRPAPVERIIQMLIRDRPSARGQLLLNGHAYRARSSEQAHRRGVLLIDERTASHTLFENLSLADNLSIAPRHSAGVGPFIDPRVRRFLTREACMELGIARSPSLHTPIGQLGLSGEQRQLLCLARWARLPVSLIVCRNPFALMDPVFRERFLHMLYQKVSEGAAALIFSSSLNNLHFCSTLYFFDEQDQLRPYNR